MDQSPVCMEKKNKQRRKRMVTVKWEKINELEIGLLMEMSEDGYSFCVEDGKIQSISLPS